MKSHAETTLQGESRATVAALQTMAVDHTFCTVMTPTKHEDLLIRLFYLEVLKTPPRKERNRHRALAGELRRCGNNLVQAPSLQALGHSRAFRNAGQAS